MARTGSRANAKRALGRTVALSLLLTLIAPNGAAAQDEPEYRMEVGGGAAVVSYVGDYNGNLLGSLQPMGTLVARYRKNPRMAWAFSLAYGTLKGRRSNSDTWYPDAEQLPPTFSNGLIDGGVRFEYNFWAYGTGREYRGAKPLAPFITLGAGITHASTNPGSTTALNVPLGIGIKYKVRERVNLTAEWRVHFTGTDRLDGVSDPYGISSSGLFKNTDGYSTLQLQLTYDIWARCKTCHNDRD